MRWPWKFGRAMAAAQALRDDRDQLAVALEKERERHLANLLDIIDLTGAQAMQFGNVGERIWPELLDDMRDLSKNAGATIMILCGNGEVLGVYPVEPSLRHG